METYFWLGPQSVIVPTTLSEKLQIMLAASHRYASSNCTVVNNDIEKCIKYAKMMGD